MSLRVPPQNLEAEKAVIGAILIDNSSVIKVFEIVKPNHFYDPRNNVLFEHIVKLYNDNKPIDVVTLTSELKKSKKLKQSGGAAYLSEIITFVPTSANIKDYAEIVKETATRRELIQFAAKLDEYSRDEAKELDEIMNETEKSILQLSTTSNTQDFYDAATLLEQQMERADEYAKNPNELRGLPTGMRDVDKILGGLHKSDLIILAARPSVGKSAFAFNIARHAAVEGKKTVMLFSLEMPGVQVIERMLAQQIQVNLWNLRMGKMSDEDYKKYSLGAGKLADSNILISDTAGITIPQLRSKARKVMIERGLDLIVVDYLQLLLGTGNIDNRAQEVGEMSRSLKILARELNIPVLVLSQLNRAVENRADRIPQLSDLRESGSIEQDADLVIFLSRDMSVDTAEENEKIKVDVSIAKHRNGPIGRVGLEFMGAQQRFIDVN